MSKVLWESVPNVGSKAREGAKAMSLAFVLLDFHEKDSAARAEGRNALLMVQFEQGHPLTI